MSDPMSAEEFSDQLGDMVGSALLNRLPAFCIASALLRATCAVSAAAGIEIDALLDDLNGFIDEMNAEQRKHLH